MSDASRQSLALAGDSGGVSFLFGTALNMFLIKIRLILRRIKRSAANINKILRQILFMIYYLLCTVYHFAGYIQ